jgi:predicted ATP-dependent endonuclease of OLD family
LLLDVDLELEQDTTVVVGRNNSGKTSLGEVVRRFLVDASPRFELEDFSTGSYDRFCAALKAREEGRQANEVCDCLPAIEVEFYFKYDPNGSGFGSLSEFIIDVDLDCTEALAVVKYALKQENVDSLFDGLGPREITVESRLAFLGTLRERIPALFSTEVWAQDPNDPSNRKLLSTTVLRNTLAADFVSAQRGLDDNTSKDRDVLARVLEGLFASASSPAADAKDKEIAGALSDAVKEIQETIDADFSTQLKRLLPTFETFGYPGLGGPELETETNLDVQRLLASYTKVKYAGYGGVRLPETYNGLGVRNLIFMLLQLVRFYKAYRAAANAPFAHLVFVEEPEAHLHPQMQEVFIRQLAGLAERLKKAHGSDGHWPVQYVVTTHSSHVANATEFEKIRYFLSVAIDPEGKVRRSKIKDLRTGLGKTPEETKNFLHQYLTLTKCDLLFADKAILVEGTGERLLVPVAIRASDATDGAGQELSSEYLTILEVGGAYAHHFLELLRFLELKTLVITDLDAVKAEGGHKCPVHKGQATSNACIRTWFGGKDVSIADLLKKSPEQMVQGAISIAYQRPEKAGGPCGRTLEDAFVLANPNLFPLVATSVGDQEEEAQEIADREKKSAFALKYAVFETGWIVPGYIADGLKWLRASEGDLGRESRTSAAQEKACLGVDQWCDRCVLRSAK